MLFLIICHGYRIIGHIGDIPLQEREFFSFHINDAVGILCVPDVVVGHDIDAVVS